MATRQQRLKTLINWWLEAAYDCPDGTPGSSQRCHANFQAAERALAEYVAKNRNKITIASGN